MESLGYDDCPIVCSNQEPEIDVYRAALCEKCPRQKRKVAFERRTNEFWGEWFSDDDLAKLHFGKMHALLYTVISSKRVSPHKRPVTTQHYLTIYEAERGRFEWLRKKLAAIG